MIVTGAQIVEAAEIVAKFDEGDAHNFAVIGRRIQELPQDNQDFWSSALLLTVLGHRAKDRSNALIEFLGNIVAYQIGISEFPVS